ncbi:MAG: BMP family lipoprotein [Candidatus Nanopelagicaceae bacterium]
MTAVQVVQVVRVVQAVSAAKVVKMRLHKSLSRFTMLPLVISMALSLLALPSHPSNAVPSSDGIDRDRKIALLFDSGGPGDGSFNDAARKGLQKAVKKYKLYAPNVRELVTDGTLGDRIYRLRLMARNGYDLMIAVGSANAEAVRRVSLEHPEQEFAILNDGTVSGLNVASLIFDDRQAAYMAGFAAALTTRSRQILYIAKDQPELNRLAEHFERGAKAAGRDGGVEINVSHMGLDFAASLDGEVDRVYSTWNLDAAVLSAVIVRNRERTRAGQIKVIANTPDQYYANLEIAKPHLLLTIDRNVDKAIGLVVTSVVRGDYVLNLLDGVNNVFGRRFTFANDGLTVKYRSKVSTRVERRIQAEIKRIASKEITF